MVHLAPRNQWMAITVLATLIFSILFVRFYRKESPPSGIPVAPLFVAVEGDINRAGTYLLEGPEVSVHRVIEAAGGLFKGVLDEIPEDFAQLKIRSGQLVRIARSGTGLLDIRVDRMPAAARLTLGEKLNVNEATEEELLLVPQMKAGLAAAILERRSRKEWQRLDELEEIAGIGPKTIEKWRGYLEANENIGGEEHEAK
jgi:hypothetical protein